MRKPKNSRNMLILTLLVLSGCAHERVISQQEQVKQPVRTAQMQLATPDPILFRQCWTEAQAQTSEGTLTPSCQLLKEWASAYDNIKPNPSPSR